MRGLDPRIHQRKFRKMDCRVKPGNDERYARARSSRRSTLPVAVIGSESANSNVARIFVGGG
jgi:hypothetical protein